MAQYFQVLSQSDKQTDNLRQCFNNQIQYVINPEDQQQAFLGQQILVTSEPLMIVDGQPQITYQAQSQHQYLIKEGATIEYTAEPESQEQQQQIFYMETSNNSQHSDRVIVEQQPPVILNTLQQPLVTLPMEVQKNVICQQIGQPQLPQQVMQPVRQLHTQLNQIQQQQRSVQVPTIQQIPAVQQQSQVGLSNVVQQRPMQHIQQQLTKEDQEAVALADGRIVTLTEYNKLVASQKAANQPTQESQNKTTSPKRKNSRTPTVRGRGPIWPTSANRGRGSGVLSQQFPMDHSAVQSELLKQQQPPMKQMARPQLSQQMRQQQTPLVRQQPAQMRQQQSTPARQPTPIRQPTPTRQPAQARQQQSQNTSPMCNAQANIAQNRSLPPKQQPANHMIQPQRIRQQLKQMNPNVNQQVYKLSDQIRQILDSNPINNDSLDTIRMLIVLDSGEQRLITFELPKEACSIYEILEQVGVSYKPDTKIDVNECVDSGIHYIVTVGNPIMHHIKVEEPPRAVEQQCTPPSDEIGDSKTPPQAIIEQPKETPKYISGLLAVCNHCGYLSEDFNKCLRCKTKLPEDIKSVSAAANVAKECAKKNHMGRGSIRDRKSPVVKSNGADKQSPVKKKGRPKVQDVEPVVLTLSSDEEESNSSPVKKSTEEQLPKSLNLSGVPPSAAKKEPSFKDIEQSSMDIDISQKQEDVEKDSVNKITLVCRTIRIGSYRYVPNEPLEVTYAGLTLKVPHPKETKNVECTIPRQGIVKVLVNFEKTLPVIFYYIAPSFAAEICEKLDMKEGSEPYFSPLSNKEPYRRITVLPDNFTDDTKHIFEQIYVLPGMMDELSSKEANDILMTSCPKEIRKSITTTSVTEVKELLIYPPTKGGLAINTEDYVCLSQDQFLNDVIIEFYIKYLVLNLPPERQQKVHAFSTFFYSRLTNKPVKASRRSHPSELDPTLTAAQKRHARVKNWTKHVNLFEKDFVIVPINENAHWFLAIICFPGLKGPTTFDGKPIQILPKQKKSKASPATKPAVAKLKEEKEMEFTLGDGSDKDEAEGDDSDLDLEEEPTEEAVVAPEVEKRPPIKQPCILIFDSLSGASRCRVVATLRDYLTCEHKVKMGVERIYNKDCIKGHCPKVPQQTNFTDCGLYLLQYVEQFFNDPIKDYHVPIRQLKNWFEELTVTKKREDISLLIKDLMRKYDKDPSCLPDITFPTLNGKLVPRVADEDDEFEDEFDEVKNSSLIKGCLSEDKDGSQEDEEEDATHSPPANDRSGITSDNEQCDAFKPDLSEPVSKQSNRDTMSYLKAKRINRHKHSDADAKKFKTATE